MKKIKKLGKKVGCSVNDIFMSSIGVAFKEYFRIKGDPLGDKENEKAQINAVLAANIRF